MPPHAELPPAFDALPIHAALPALAEALATRSEAVLVAPPGAGKTTVVPLALKDEPWVSGRRIVVLEPRRLAARAAASRMAQTLGEPVGATVGYRVRMDARVSAATRIEVVTEGVFTRMILDDPALDGVAAVLFDEFHERSLDADLGLALARDAQGVLREDLRLLVMSATLDGARVSALLGDAPVVESQGRAFPVETRYLGRDALERIEPQVVRAIQKALAEETGGVLVFLPGAAEIGRVERLLLERLASRTDIEVHPLYGALSPAAQDRAVEPPPPGRRKVVLATSIAETSLTLRGVRVVVDAGLSRVPRYDPGSGLTRLETQRVSRAAADQRRGRAGRTAPGVCYRLWDEAETRALAPFARPEMLDSDLSGLALALAQWGARSADGLAFLDPPPRAAFAEARTLLSRLGALDARGTLSAHGRRLAELPLTPRLAHMVVRAADAGAAQRAAHIAALLTERGLGGDGADLSERLARFAADGSSRARDARALAARWAARAGAGRERPPPSEIALSDGALLALAFPERVAKGRGPDGVFNLVSGRAVRLDPASSLAREPWLAVGEVGRGATSDRVILAAPLSPDEIEAFFAADICEETTTAVEADGRLRARRRRRLGALVLHDRRLDRPPPDLARAAWLAEIARRGLAALPLNAASHGLIARVAFLSALDGPGEGTGDAGWPPFDEVALVEEADAWLGDLLEGVSRLADLDPGALHAALLARLAWPLRTRLDVEAPEYLVLPTGTRAVIDYAAEGGPRVEARVQELYGMAVHPTVAGGRMPLTLALLSPARRPVQVTRDLPGFWRGSWAAVRIEMKGRYPRHLWPEDPLAADPTTRAKPRGT